MEKIGFGGNGTVYVDSEGNAMKVLRNKRPEALMRFRKEIDILNLLKGKFSNVCEIIDFNIEKKKYTMKRYINDSNSILLKTKSDPKETVKKLLPVVKTLGELYREYGVVHRDLKPSNLLVDDEENLIIADFGCVYLVDKESERLTQTNEWVGPAEFRAPEYQYGKVENVDASGDIFSVGKLLWYFINGTKNDVFPYTLWYPKVYNLANRVDCHESLLIEVNTLISKMCSVETGNRPNYDEVIINLTNILIDKFDKNIEPDKKRFLDMKKKDAEINTYKEEYFSKVSNLIIKFDGLLTSAIGVIQSEYPGIELINEIVKAKRKLNMPVIESRIKAFDAVGLVDRVRSRNLEFSIFFKEKHTERLSVPLELVDNGPFLTGHISYNNLPTNLGYSYVVCEKKEGLKLFFKKGNSTWSEASDALTTLKELILESLDSL